MNTSHKIVTAAFFTTLLLVIAGMVNTSLAAQKQALSPEQVAAAYISALEQGDIETVVAHVKDTRDHGKTSKKEQYQQYVQQDREDQLVMKLVSVDLVDHQNANMNLILSNKYYENAPLTLPIIRERGKWKVLIDGSIGLDTKPYLRPEYKEKFLQQ